MGGCPVRMILSCQSQRVVSSVPSSSCWVRYSKAEMESCVGAVDAEDIGADDGTSEDDDGVMARASQ